MTGLGQPSGPEPDNCAHAPGGTRPPRTGTPRTAESRGDHHRSRLIPPRSSSGNPQRHRVTPVTDVLEHGVVQRGSRRPHRRRARGPVEVNTSGPSLRRLSGPPRNCAGAPPGRPERATGAHRSGLGSEERLPPQPNDPVGAENHEPAPTLMGVRNLGRPRGVHRQPFALAARGAVATARH